MKKKEGEKIKNKSTAKRIAPPGSWCTSSTKNREQPTEAQLGGNLPLYTTALSLPLCVQQPRPATTGDTSPAPTRHEEKNASSPPGSCGARAHHIPDDSQIERHRRAGPRNDAKNSSWMKKLFNWSESDDVWFLFPGDALAGQALQFSDHDWRMLSPVMTQKTLAERSLHPLLAEIRHFQVDVNCVETLLFRFVLFWFCFFFGSETESKPNIGVFSGSSIGKICRHCAEWPVAIHHSHRDYARLILFSPCKTERGRVIRLYRISWTHVTLPIFFLARTSFSFNTPWPLIICNTSVSCSTSYV